MAEEQPKYPNWIEDTNKWKLERPADSFLAGLYTYDPMLVIVPSRFTRHYLMCRRRQYSAGLGDVAMVDNKHPDTNMCYAYGLVPIRPLKFGSGVISWSDANLQSLLADLRSRDTWAHTGGPEGNNLDAAWQFVEEQERLQAQAQQLTFRDNMRHRARDAWRSLTARIGARNRRASDYHGVARAPQPKQRVVLTDAS